MASWDSVLADWSVDCGISHDAALMALGGTVAFLEARQAHKDGASEHVVRQWLDKALRDGGIDRIPVD